MKFFEMLFDKLRINVVIVAGVIAFLVHDFGDKLIALLPGLGLPPELIITLLSTLIGVGIGGLIAAMIQMFNSPQVPADSHERIVKALVQDTAEQIAKMQPAPEKEVKMLSGWTLEAAVRAVGDLQTENQQLRTGNGGGA